MQKKTGKHPFGLQIVINGDARMLPINIIWYARDFDSRTETFKFNDEHPDIVRDLNLIVGKEKARVNDILTRYRLTNKVLTLKQFRWEFSNYTSRENVHEWLKWGIFQKWPPFFSPKWPPITL
ncbi:Arm DNA-binding domain-containing protein [Pedobacter sp.]